MDIKVIAKNITVEDAIREYCEKKLNRLGKHLVNITSIKMELTGENSKARPDLFVAQATININGILLRGEHKDRDLKTAVDAVTDIMERQIDKYKKRYTVNKSKVHESIRVSGEPAIDDGEENKPVVKIKKFKVKPMKVEHAIDQMELLGHDFFLFVNDDDNSVNVVYRRKDGYYGLIQPETA